MFQEPESMRPHPWHPRKVLKESYSKHVSGLLIIKMGKAENRIREEIKREQVTHWTPAEIMQRFPDGRA